MDIFGNKLYLDDKLKTIDTYTLHEILGAVDTLKSILGDDYKDVSIVSLNNLTITEIKRRRK